jgi:tetratricopeptide (TPR) repeat protein
VALAALLAHGGALRNGFVWDDEAVVVDSAATRDLSSLPRVVLSPDERPPYYRPLNRASYLVDHALFGMDPRAFHAVSLALHALSAALLFLLASRLLGDVLLAAVTALLLAVHPLAVEVVSFVTARNNLFALAFSLAAALALARALDRRSRAWTLASAAAFLLGLLSKEPAGMLLPLLLSWLALPGPAEALSAEPFLRRTRWLLPHLAALAAYLVLRAVSLSGVPVPADPAPAPLLDRVAALAWIVPEYVRLLAWPEGLTVLHPATPPAGWAAGAAVSWAGLMGVGVLQVRRPTPAGAFGLLWAALTFAPASGLVAIPASPVAERFAYLPLAGVALVAADLLGRLRLRGRMRVALGAAAALLLLALAVRTAARTADWRDDVTLFASASRVNPGSRDAWFNLGVALKDRGDLTAAQSAWESALALAPGDAEAHAQLGTLHAVGGDLDRGEVHLRLALTARPDLDQARYNLALVLERQGRTAEALAEHAAVAAHARGSELGRAAAARARALAGATGGRIR